MRRISWFIICFLLVFSIKALSQEAGNAGDLKVEKIAAATSVENREPAGEGSEFEVAAGKIYCWTKISVQTPPATVKHVWYANEKKVFEFSLELKHPSTRTWSVKTIKAGNWRVEVTDTGGKVLSQVAFIVK